MGVIGQFTVCQEDIDTILSNNKLSDKRMASAWTAIQILIFRLFHIHPLSVPNSTSFDSKFGIRLTSHDTASLKKREVKKLRAVAIPVHVQM